MIHALMHRPTGRVAITATVLALTLLVVSNVAASLFWTAAGGVGLLDLSGGANLLDPHAAIALPASGPERLLAIRDAYTPAAAQVHAWLLCTLDLVFPAAIGLMGWSVVAWASHLLPRRPQRVLRALGATAGIFYPAADWTENVLELALLAGHDGAATSLVIVTPAKTAVFAAMLILMTAALVTRLVRLRVLPCLTSVLAELLEKQPRCGLAKSQSQHTKPQCASLNGTDPQFRHSREGGNPASVTSKPTPFGFPPSLE
jgi:hypothetical protein